MRTTPETLASNIIARHMARAETILDIIDARAPADYEALLKAIEPDMGKSQELYDALRVHVPESARQILTDLDDAYGIERAAAVQAGYLLGIASGLRIGGAR